MAKTEWLNDVEQTAWRPFAELMLVLPSRLEEPLRAHGLTFFDYTVLAALSYVADRTMPVSELAYLANGSLSRTSHGARRMEQRGLLERRQSPDDGRVTLVTLTAEGHQKLTEVAPIHVESVRRMVFDALTPDQAAALGDLATALLANINPDSPWVRAVARDVGRAPTDP